MPQYEFRCQACTTEFTLSYPSIAAYRAATPACPACQSQALSRLIRKVALQGTQAHDYRRMSADQMLRVLESGDRRQVTTMFKQVKGDSE